LNSEMWLVKQIDEKLLANFFPQPVSYCSKDLSSARLENSSWFEKFRSHHQDSYDSNFKDLDCAKLSIYSFIGGDLEYVIWGADLIAWLFIFDDFHGEARSHESQVELDSLARSLKESAEKGLSTQPDSPLHNGLANLSRRGFDLDDNWSTRFSNSLESYFSGCHQEYGYRVQGQRLDFNTYRNVREHSIGVYPLLDFIERLTISEESLAPFRQKQVFVDFDRSICLLCAWVNDVYSYPKEKSDKDPNNLISVLIRDSGISLNDAENAAIEVIHQEFIKLEAAESLILKQYENVPAVK